MPLFPGLRCRFTVRNPSFLKLALATILAKNPPRTTLITLRRIRTSNTSHSFQRIRGARSRIQPSGHGVNTSGALTLSGNDSCSAERQSPRPFSRTKQRAVNTPDIRFVSVVIIVNRTPRPLCSSRTNLGAAKVFDSSVRSTIHELNSPTVAFLILFLLALVLGTSLLKALLTPPPLHALDAEVGKLVGLSYRRERYIEDAHASPTLLALPLSNVLAEDTASKSSASVISLVLLPRFPSTLVPLAEST